MKNSKKKVLVVALIVCLIAIISAGSLAWFTASDDVTNNFYVGTTDDDTSADDVFGVDVWEKDENGNVIGADDDTNGIEYTNILPGDVLAKEPYFENTGVHSQYLRATVTVTGASVLKAAMGNDWADADTLFNGFDSTVWSLDNVAYDDVNDKLVYVFYYNEVLAAGTYSEALFTDVVIPATLTLEQAQSLAGDMFTVNVLGEAIQSENLPNATNAKTAFELYWN